MSSSLDGSLGGVAQRALDHGAGERAAEGGAGVDVLLGVDTRRRRFGGAYPEGFVDRLAIDHGLDLGEPKGAIPDADHAYMCVDRVATGVLVVEHRCRGECEIAAPSRKLLESPSAPCRP